MTRRGVGWAQDKRRRVPGDRRARSSEGVRGVGKDGEVAEGQH